MKTESLRKQNIFNGKSEKERQDSTESYNSFSMLVPRDVQNVQALLLSTQNLNKYSWEKDYCKLLNQKKTNFNEKDKKIIKYLLLKPMPENLRPTLWLISTGAEREKLNNPKYYNDLLNNYPADIPSPYEQIIEMDIQRTFPDNPLFKVESTLKKLRNILTCYSRRNISIGYCQGFNFIVGVLLHVFDDEESAFWVFVQIVEGILPLNYFSEMAGVLVDTTIFNLLFKKYIPDLQKHLSDSGLDSLISNVIYKWFTSLFIQDLPIEITMFIWDILFLEGLFKIMKPLLMSITSIEEFVGVTDQIGSLIKSPSQLVYYLILRKYEFDENFINKNRTLIEKSIISGIEQRADHQLRKREESKENLRNSLADDKTPCNRHWPVCLYDLDYKHVITNYSIIHCLQTPSIIDNYFFNVVKNNYDSNDSHKISRADSSSRASSLWNSEASDRSSKSSQSFKRRSEIKTKSLFDSKSSKTLAKRSFKYRHYKNMLVDRRQHFCQNTNYEKEYINSLFHSIEIKKKVPISHKNIRYSAFNSDELLHSKKYKEDFHNSNKLKRIIHSINENDCFDSVSNLFENFNPIPFCSKDEFKFNINN